MRRVTTSLAVYCSTIPPTVQAVAELEKKKHEANVTYIRYSFVEQRMSTYNFDHGIGT